MASEAQELADQLRQVREQFRTERAAALADIARRTKRVEKAESEVRTAEQAVAAEKKRIRALYEKCLDRIRVRWASERKSCGHTRAECDAAEERFRDFYARKKAELDSRAGRAEADRERLKAAWELLAEGQRRAIADRQQSEDWLARHREALDLRTKMFGEQHKLFESNRQSFEARQPELIAEIAGLETRATHLRQTIAKLEADREKLQVAEVSSNALAVPLAPQFGHRGEAQQVDSLLVELTREKRGLALARAELARQADGLSDQRAILAEQVNALAGARDLWRSAEANTAGELHAIALGIRAGEQDLDGRERDLVAAERRRRNEDHALVELRFKLENWQLALMAKEASVQTDAEKLDESLAAKCDAVERRGAALEATAAAWTGLRRRESEFYRAELDRLAVAKAECTSEIASLRDARDAYAERSREVAARDLASAGQRPGPLATRRGRILERRWTKHFLREEKRLAKLERTLEAGRVELDERMRRIDRETESFLDRQTHEIAERTAHELDRLVGERRLADARLEAELEAQLRFRTEGDARRLRSQIARIAESIQTANLTHPDEQDVLILPLRSAQAA